MDKKLSRRQFLKVSSAVAGSALAAAAAPQAVFGSGTQLAPLAQEEPVTIRYSQFTAPPWEPPIQTYVDAFNERSEKVKVKWEPFPWGTYWPNVQTGLASGNPQDVILLVHFNMDKYVFAGACAPLDDFVARDNFDLSVFYPSYVNHVTMGGKFYGIGWAIDSSAVFYNKNLFNDMGVEFPPLDGDWDWNGYRELAKQMTTYKADGSFETVGSTLWLNMNTDLPVDSLYANGGRQINDDEDFTRTLIGEPEAREAILFALNLYLEDKVVQASNPEHSNPWIEEFNSGRYALHWGFANNTTNFIQAPFEWDIVPLPVSPNTGIRKSSSNPNSYTMMAQSQLKDAAWEFMKWLADGTDELGPQVVWCRDVGSLVPFAAVNDEYWMKQQAEERGFNRQAGLDSFADHWRYPHFPGYADWYIPLGEELSKVFQGMDPNAAIDAAVERGNSILAELGPTPAGWLKT